MGKEYCIDTSGLSKPIQDMPQDIHLSLWRGISDILSSGRIAVTTDIYEEMKLLPGPLGQHIQDSKSALILEVCDADWDWEAYIQHSNNLQQKFKEYIQEFNGGVKASVGLNDISIIALAKTLDIPLGNMESSVGKSLKKKRIPDVCGEFDVESITFSDFLRREKIAL